jgi:hypothetical protein
LGLETMSSPERVGSVDLAPRLPTDVDLEKRGARTLATSSPHKLPHKLPTVPLGGVKKTGLGSFGLSWMT